MKPVAYTATPTTQIKATTLTINGIFIGFFRLALSGIHGVISLRIRNFLLDKNLQESIEVPVSHNKLILSFLRLYMCLMSHYTEKDLHSLRGQSIDHT